MPLPVVLDQNSFSLMHQDEQLNWLRVNRALIDLSVKILPRYYSWNTDGNIIDMKKDNSVIQHMCGLLRVQLYFIMRFNHFKPYLSETVRKISDIPEHMGYDCYLI